MRVRDVLRVKGTPYKELGLDAAHWSDDQLIDQMLAHPILINRPIVVSPWRAAVSPFGHGDRAAAAATGGRDLQRRRHDSPGGHADRRQRPGPRAGAARGRSSHRRPDRAGASLFAYATVSGERVGFGGFEHMGRDVLVRSLVVLPQARHRGTGSGMLALLLRRAFDEGGRPSLVADDDGSAVLRARGLPPRGARCRASGDPYHTAGREPVPFECCAAQPPHDLVMQSRKTVPERG